MKQFISSAAWIRIGVAWLTLALTACASPATTSPQKETAAQPNCDTVEYVEDLNKGTLKRVAHIKGENSIVFIALDPIWSEPEFDNLPYRNSVDMEEIKKVREHLKEQEIDEVVVWRLSRRTMGAAVPFKEGCLVSGYGEPDSMEKLKIMHKTFLLISKHGLDDSSVRNSIKKLLMVSRYAPHFSDEMIDIIIDNLRPLMEKPGFSA